VRPVRFLYPGPRIRPRRAAMVGTQGTREKCAGAAS
jgi:hypothetical protein